jgi:hypothetical protein
MVIIMPIIDGMFRHQLPHDVLHPDRQCRQPVSKVGGDGGTLIFVGEDMMQPSQDAPPIIRIGAEQIIFEVRDYEEPGVRGFLDLGKGFADLKYALAPCYPEPLSTPFYEFRPWSAHW